MSRGRWATLVLGAVAVLAAMTLTLADVTLSTVTVLDEVYTSNAVCGTILGPSVDDRLAEVNEDTDPEVRVRILAISAATPIDCDAAITVRTYVVVGLAALGLVLLIVSGPRGDRSA